MYEWSITKNQNDGLVQDCSNSISKALELLQSCTKPPSSSQPYGSFTRIIYCCYTGTVPVEYFSELILGLPLTVTL